MSKTVACHLHKNLPPDYGPKMKTTDPLEDDNSSSGFILTRKMEANRDKA